MFEAIMFVYLWPRNYCKKADNSVIALSNQ